MNETKESLFLAGVEVWTRRHNKEMWRKGKVEKVYKNGNFILEGSRNQWRPWGDGAHPTGDYSYSSRPEVMLSTEKNDATAQTQNAIFTATSKAWKIEVRLRRIGPGMAIADLDAIAAILAKYETKDGSNDR